MRTRHTTRSRRNSVEGAAELSEVFHGRPAKQVTEYLEELSEHRNLADLGRLLTLHLKDRERTKISFEPGVRLACNESGTQLYAVGGDQSVDLDQFPELDQSKESVFLGPIHKIEYFTSKEHLGKADKTPGPYIHTFGEEGGTLPLLCYDTRNGLLSFVGGSYHIDPDMDGGKYSAGIRD